MDVFSILWHLGLAASDPCSNGGIWNHIIIQGVLNNSSVARVPVLLWERYIYVASIKTRFNQIMSVGPA